MAEVQKSDPKARRAALWLLAIAALAGGIAIAAIEHFRGDLELWLDENIELLLDNPSVVLIAAAFLISEFTGVSYTEIIKHALVPALVSLALFAVVVAWRRYVSLASILAAVTVPALLGGAPAISQSQTDAQRWPIITDEDERPDSHGESSVNPFVILAYSVGGTSDIGDIASLDYWSSPAVKIALSIVVIAYTALILWLFTLVMMWCWGRIAPLI